MSLKHWEIKGLSLPLDLDELETAERYESAFLRMKAEENAIPKDGFASVRIRAYFEIYPHLFENLFGSDVADHLFKDIPTNLKAYEEIYFSFLDFVKNQRLASAKAYAEKMLEFKPSNRQQRRKQQKRRRK